jgi:hypothetical protein
MTVLRTVRQTRYPSSGRKPQAVDSHKLVVHLEAPYGAYKQVLAPVREVVVAGLSWPTEYWVGLAIAWLEQGVPIDQEVFVLLDRVAQTRHFAQSVRHRAFALARRWERERQNDA